MDKIPKINSKAVCIACDESADLAREISTYFSSSSEYFSVFNFLKLIEFKKEVVDFGEDGYIGQVLGGQASVYINNSIVQIRPEFIIFAGLNENQKSFLTGLPAKRIIHIDVIEDIKKYPDLFKESEKHMGISNVQQNSDNLVVIEDGQDLVTVIAENLGRSMGSKIVYVEETEDHLRNKITKYIDEWKEKSKYSSYIKLENLVKKRVVGIDFSLYKIATFFTNGLPYGLVLNNPIPFCYVHKGYRPDIFIINSIFYSKKSFGTAICFSIDQFLISEPKEVSSIFLRNNLIPIQLFKDRATTFNFEHYVEHLPYDILHISSHGGIKTSAYYVVQKFKDRYGGIHIVEYYEVPSFSSLPLENTDNIAVYIKNIFLRFDGASWMSKELKDKKLPHFVFEDMRKEISLKNKKKGRIKRELVTDPIIDASTLMCNDGHHQGQFHEIGAGNAPLIFNNSCWSWSEISTFFLAAGVRGYVGTLWPIINDVATKGAIKFYQDILDKEKTIAVATWELNKEISVLSAGQENIFFVWTLPFTKMKKAVEDDYNNFIEEVIYKLGRWMNKVDTKKENDVRENSERIIKFILWAVYKEFKFNIIEASWESAMENFNYDLNKHSSILKRSLPL
jgi:hypothetical protein